MVKLRIIDYGVGNIYSALKAFKLYAEDTELTEDKDDLLNADAVVLPGVGAFAAGMGGLEERNLIETVQEIHAKGTPMLGICLGAQLLMGKSFEFGQHEGLGIVPGEVKHFPEFGKRIPHIGWNEIEEDQSWNGTIFEGIGENPEMYFVHSFYMNPNERSHSLATTTYGGFNFTSVIKEGNTYGCQFHPEKSSKVGLKIIENFVRMVEGS